MLEIFSLGLGSAVEKRQKKKTGSNGKNIVERSKPSGGLGRGKGDAFPLPRLPLAFAHVDFFLLFPSLVPG